MNLRTTRLPSLSSIRQCRKSGSVGSSVFNQKSTENVSPGLEKVIFPIPTESDFLPRRLLWSLPCAYCLGWYLRSNSSGLILSRVYRCGSCRTCCLSPQLQQIRFQPFGLGSGEPLEHEAALVFNSVAPILGIRNTKCCITEHAVSLSLSNPEGSGTPSRFVSGNHQEQLSTFGTAGPANAARYILWAISSLRAREDKRGRGRNWATLNRDENAPPIDWWSRTTRVKESLESFTVRV